NGMGTIDGAAQRRAGARSTRAWGQVAAACAACAMALAAPDAAAQIMKQWSAGQGQWGNPANWSPAGVPGLGNNVWVGSPGFAEDETVFVNQPVAVNQLVVATGMGLQSSIHCCGEDVIGHPVTVTGQTTISSGGRMVMYNSGPGLDFQTGALAINSAQSFLLMQQSSVRVNNLFSLSGGAQLRGSGIMQLAGSGTTLNNNGQIQKGPGLMVITQLGDGLFNLDGSTNEGRIIVSGTSDAVLVLQGSGLTDSFSGEIQLGPNSHLIMQVGPWEADANSTILVFDLPGSNPARLSGSQATLAGELRLLFSSHLRVEAPAVLAPTIDVTVGNGNTLEFVDSASAHIQGGEYVVSSAGHLDFRGTTFVGGGSFRTHTLNADNGAVRFFGPTTWNGTANFIGVARQVGNATVSGATLINAMVFDMDGDGATTWNVNASTVINALRINNHESNLFQGTLNLTGGFASRLTLNLDEPGDQWIMAGQMNLAGQLLAPFPIDRLHGSPVRVTGTTHIEHRVRVAADATFEAGSTVELAGAGALVQFTGRTRVLGGATVQGPGTIENGLAGHLSLGHGASLGQAGLVNHGLLEVGSSAGAASVDRFRNDAAGTWLVELGGHLAGAQHDLLLVSGGAVELDGGPWCRIPEGRP
ncbi:MAG TPA: hypothetical protein PJ982_12430, partial [Lacipirellulaceae bacterium]|nr:hypothetical protein [Lacipirellulaceae bacterium]